MVFCIPRLTPPARCAALSFALSSCTPSGTATPAKPFRGGWTRLPSGGAGRLDGTSEPARLTEGVLFDGWQQLKITNCTPFAASRHFPQRGQQGSLRIRLGAFQMVFCVPRLTPPARCAVLSFALSGCTPSRTATPAKPFRGGWQEVNRIRWRGGCFPGFCRWSRRRRCPGRGTGPGAGRARRRPRSSRRARG